MKNKLKNRKINICEVNDMGWRSYICTNIYVSRLANMAYSHTDNLAVVFCSLLPVLRNIFVYLLRSKSSLHWRHNGRDSDSTVYSDADQRRHHSSASLGFVWGIHREPVNSPHKWPVTWKMFPFDDVIMWYKSARERGKTGDPPYNRC